MRTQTEIDKQIASYLCQLNTDQKKAVLSVVKTFAKEQDHWNDDEFIIEMDRRVQEFEAGKAKLYTLEELEFKARQSIKAKKE